MKTNSIQCLLLILALCGVLPVCGTAMSVVDSKHDLSANSSNSIKAATETEVCKFCHTPHRAGPDLPLWNHQTSGAVYSLYSSPTLISKPDQPNGASKLCLSCHDGTVALGMIYSSNTPIEMRKDGAPITTMPLGANNVGTDLSQDHPISFTYDSALANKKGNLVDPATLTNKVRLDHNGRMQCTTCHDPHDNRYGNFLVLPPSGSNLCSTCHVTSASASAQHTISSAQLGTVAAAALAPAPALVGAKTTNASNFSKTQAKQAAKSVASNGCNNCHATHGAGARKGLLLHNREEQTCFACHNGTVDRKNLQTEFNKRSVHPVIQTSKLHQGGGEDLLNSPRHVACADCHNSHAAKASNARSAALRPPSGSAPAASGPILQVKGISRSGAAISAVNYEYELCFRCHGDSNVRTPASVNRVRAETNTRQQFNPANQSFHPVVASGKNPNVPSLISPYLPGSVITCSDCHNNDQGPGAGGSGPNGPHGSAYAPLLERRLDTADQMMESPASYALCYKCHARDSILADQSFRAVSPDGKDRGHRFHVVDQKTACTTCHDSHGVANNKHLINFNPDYVRPASNGRLEYKSTGFQSGTCTLSCHGYNHLNSSYPIQTSLAPVPGLRRK